MALYIPKKITARYKKPSQTTQIFGFKPTPPPPGLLKDKGLLWIFFFFWGGLVGLAVSVQTHWQLVHWLKQSSTCCLAFCHLFRGWSKHMWLRRGMLVWLPPPQLSVGEHCMIHALGTQLCCRASLPGFLGSTQMETCCGANITGQVSVLSQQLQYV